MKLKFKISEPTDIESEIIIKRVVTILEHKKYDLTNITSDVVEFYESPWKLMWNFEAVNRFSGGKFEICSIGGVKSVKFTYYLSVSTLIIALIIISFIIIKQRDLNGALFVLAFYTMGVTINAFTLRASAHRTLKGVLIRPLIPADK